MEAKPLFINVTIIDNTVMATSCRTVSQIQFVRQLLLLISILFILFVRLRIPPKARTKARRKVFYTSLHSGKQEPLGVNLILVARYSIICLDAFEIN